MGRRVICKSRRLPSTVVVGIGLVWVGCAAGQTHAQAPDQELSATGGAARAPHATGGLLVKFTEEAAQAIEQARREGNLLHLGIESLDRLMTKYGATAMESVFPAIQRRPPASSAAENPGLSRIYTLRLGPGSDVVEAASEFMQDPHVEYAQPNYMATTQDGLR